MTLLDIVPECSLLSIIIYFVLQIIAKPQVFIWRIVISCRYVELQELDECHVRFLEENMLLLVVNYVR